MPNRQIDPQPDDLSPYIQQVLDHVQRPAGVALTVELTEQHLTDPESGDERLFWVYRILAEVALGTVDDGPEGSSVEAWQAMVHAGDAALFTEPDAVWANIGRQVLVAHLEYVRARVAAPGHAAPPNTQGRQQAIAYVESLQEYLSAAAEDDDYVLPDDGLTMLADVHTYLVQDVL